MKIWLKRNKKKKKTFKTHRKSTFETINRTIKKFSVKLCESSNLRLHAMATLLYTVLSFTAGVSLHCAVRREISPCTCIPHETFANTIIVTCQKMESFNHVVDVLQDKFTPDYQIWLKIMHSNLLDFEKRHFAEMNINIKHLRLNHNGLRWAFSDGSFCDTNCTITLCRAIEKWNKVQSSVSVEKIESIKYLI